MIWLSLINKYRRNTIDNHTRQIAQYAKLETLYSTIIYLQKEVVKVQNELKQLKLEELHSIKENKNVG